MTKPDEVPLVATLAATLLSNKAVISEQMVTRAVELASNILQEVKNQQAREAKEAANAPTAG